MTEITINRTCAIIDRCEQFTSGRVGARIKFSFSPEWAGLNKTAVFTNGDTTIDVLNVTDECVVPHEVLAISGKKLKVGVYGFTADDDGNIEIAIPTVYAELGKVVKGADPSGDESTEPSLPVWAQIQSDVNALENRIDGITQPTKVSQLENDAGYITAEDLPDIPSLDDYAKKKYVDDATTELKEDLGDLDDLTTTAKNNLVAAINEVKQSGDATSGIANVKNFGAVGDGVADDTEAIQNALDSGKDVYFPIGTYRTTVPINFDTFVDRQFDAENAFIRYEGNGYAFNMTHMRDCQIKFGTIYANNGGCIRLYGTSGDGMTGDWSQYVDISFFRMRANTESGNCIFVDNSAGCWINEVRLHKGRFEKGLNGVLFGNSGGSHWVFNEIGFEGTTNGLTFNLATASTKWSDFVFNACRHAEIQSAGSGKKLITVTQGKVEDILWLEALRVLEGEFSIATSNATCDNWVFIDSQYNRSCVRNNVFFKTNQLNLSSDANLNDCVEVGTEYYCTSSAIASAITNSPTQIAFRMEVGYSLGRAYIEQRVYNFNSPIAYRRFKGTDNVWRDWTQFGGDFGTLKSDVDKLKAAGTGSVVEVTANTDLNNCTTIGKYYCQQYATAQTLAHTPKVGAFVMDVYYGNGKAYKTQIFKLSRSAEMYIRWANADATVWSEWVQISGLTIPTVPQNVSAFNNDSGYLTQHQSLAAYRTAAAQDIIDNGKQPVGDYATSGELDALADIVDGKADAADIPSLAGYATETYVQNYHDSTKQDVISDLSTIRSGASKGATAYQKPTSGIPASDLASGVIPSVPTSLSQLSEDTTHRLVTDAEKSTWNAKQSAISDLATIRSGAALGATAVQPEAGKGLFSGSYNDLTNKPTIPSAVTESTVSGWGFTKNTGTYSKPSGGIPKTDLASAVQTSLGKADTALQSVPNTYALKTDVPTDAHINSLIDAKLGVIENGSY